MEEKDEAIITVLILILLGIFGFLRNRDIKKRSPEKTIYVDKTWHDAPKGMHVTGYKDKEMDQYFNGKTFIAWGIIAFIILLILLMSNN